MIESVPVQAGPLGYMRLNPKVPSQLELLKEIVGYSSPSAKGSPLPGAGDSARTWDLRINSSLSQQFI